MGILDWFNPARWLMLLGLVIALTLGYFAWADHIGNVREAKVNARWTAAINAQKAKAAALLATETAKVAKVEGELKSARAELEKRDADAAKTIAQLRTDLRANSRAAGGTGLRDPFAGSRLGSSGSKGASTSGSVSSAASGSEASGVLSAEFEGLLLTWAEEADTINRAYATCRADAIGLREKLGQ